MTYHKVCNKSNMTGATSGAGIAYPSRATKFTPSFNGICVARSSVLCVMFCRSLFVLVSFFFWSLCCLSFFDLWLLITPLACSNFSLKIKSNITSGYRKMGSMSGNKDPVKRYTAGLWTINSKKAIHITCQQWQAEQDKNNTSYFIKQWLWSLSL